MDKAQTEGIRIPYGADSSQFGDLFLPSARTRPAVVVILHGGFWRAAYGADLGVPLARDLTARGWACWNLEYRRVGNGGGWPQTFHDVADGIDKLADLAGDHQLSLENVIVLGHSAGGQLAAWAGGRGQLPENEPGADPLVPVTAVLSQSGVLDLSGAARSKLGNDAVGDFLGGSPQQHPRRYRLADPLQQIPLTVPVYAVHATGDSTVPIEQSETYVRAATAAGATAELIRVPGNHFSLIDPDSEAFNRCREVLDRLWRR